MSFNHKVKYSLNMKHDKLVYVKCIDNKTETVIIVLKHYQETSKSN